ncbi:TMEM143 family protein [Neptunomonas sp. XY-337]|uniref:TMEM143 family protein n=1 Tax=Neptunomonas sp. XY-337 TaxID=2561897 RepID=UPI0010AB4C24|nr:TMEM143 family protein [Neptunomonas sp. XY-337]
MNRKTLKPLRFIPFRKRDIIEMCLVSNGLNQQEREQFRHVATQIQQLFHVLFLTQKEAMKDSFSSINPDRDTFAVELPATMAEEITPFPTLLSQLLEKANYEALNQSVIEDALSQDSLFKVRLEVDFSDYAEVVLYVRGEHEKTESVPKFWGLKSAPLTFTNYERVALYLRIREDLPTERAETFNLPPGGIILKLFKNVPKADLEMLFPNTQVRMRLIDKLMIGVPAAVSGGLVVTTKLGASLVLIGSLLGFWLGLHSRPVELNQAALVALLAGLGALGSYLWKQFNNFKNRKLKFVQKLTQNLYFKNLDNNAGVFHRLLDEAEEEECKEAILAYYFLLTAQAPMSRPMLDHTIEQWLSDKWQAVVDFEIDDALEKLTTLGLISTNTEGVITPVSLENATAKLAQRWANFQ